MNDSMTGIFAKSDENLLNRGSFERGVAPVLCSGVLYVGDIVLWSKTPPPQSGMPRKRRGRPLNLKSGGDTSTHLKACRAFDQTLNLFEL